MGWETWCYEHGDGVAALYLRFEMRSPLAGHSGPQRVVAGCGGLWYAVVCCGMLWYVTFSMLGKMIKTICDPRMKT